MTDQHTGLEQSLHSKRDPLDLAGLIGSRLCHDLVSPLGAIGNGLELLQMTGGGDGPELDLIRESYLNATAKLQFCRIAFGTGGERPVALADMARLATDPRRGTRAAIRWAAEGDAPRAQVRLVFLLLLCAEAAVPAGGDLTVDRNEDGWAVCASAAAVRVEPTLWRCLQGGSPGGEIDGGRIQFALAPLAAQAAGFALKVEMEQDNLTVFAIPGADKT